VRWLQGLAQRAKRSAPERQRAGLNSGIEPRPGDIARCGRRGPDCGAIITAAPGRSWNATDRGGYVSEVVRERGTSGATFAAVVIMISGGFGILEGHSLVATRTYCMSVWVLLVSLAILFDHPISRNSHPVRGVEHPLARVNALDTSRWRTHDHEHCQQRDQRRGPPGDR
jgi:hypothetical protein